MLQFPISSRSHSIKLLPLVPFLQQKDFKVRNSTEQNLSPTDFPELQKSFTQAEAFERLCPLRISHGSESKCEGSGCMAWVWEPGQRDARVAKGRCGMAPVDHHRDPDAAAERDELADHVKDFMMNAWNWFRRTD
jgi:hypothetical protein